MIDQRSRYFAPTYNASLNLRQPWFESQANELGLGFFAHRRSAPGIYIDKGFGTSATFTREIAERASASANYRFELNRVDAGDVYFCINYGVCDQPTLDALRERQSLSPFTLTGTTNRANDPLSPTRGFRGTVDFEHASSFTFSSFRYNRATVDAAMYFPIRKRGHCRDTCATGLDQGARKHDSGAWRRAAKTTSCIRESGSMPAARGPSVAIGENQLGPRVLTIPASTSSGA